MLIGEYLQKHATEQHNHPFLLIENRTYTYGEFNQIVNRTVTFLKNNCGVQKGSHISVVLPNDIDFMVLFFAIAKMGAVIVPMNPLFKADLLEYMIKQSDSTLLIQHKDSEIIAGLEIQTLVIENGDIIDLTKNHPEDTNLANDIKPQDLFSIIYTSGTTSRPKGVLNSQRTYTSAGIDMVEALKVTKSDITYLFLPLFHANPQFYGIMSAIVAGNTILIDKKFSATAFWKKAQNHEFSIFTYVGTVLSILAKTYPLEKPLEKRIRGTGGGAPTEAWEKVSMTSGIKVHELYGMSETGGFVTINTERDWKFDSVGKARAGVEVAILNEADEKCPLGEIGEIAIRPNEPNIIFNGYYNEPQKSLDVFSNLWFHTGDCGWLDKDGFLHFKGRLKDIIRKKGENLSPTYIEEVFLRLPEVREAACIGIADELAGEEIKLCLVMDDHDFNINRLTQWGEENLPDIMQPRYFERMDRLPKTPTEKIEKHKLRYMNQNVIDRRSDKNVPL